MPSLAARSLAGRSLVAVTLACAAAAPADAQSSARDRAERQRVERLRVERERVERERVARERAARVQREKAQQAERQRREREIRDLRAREARERALAARRRQDPWRRDTERPRVSVGGGLDVRRFDGDADRYVVHAGVDFRGRSGLGMRPEVTYAWSEPGPAATLFSPGGAPIGTFAAGRSRALGVALHGTYTFLRGAPVRPYVLAGGGILSTRESVPDVLPATSLPPGTFTAQVASRGVHRLDAALSAGAGLEFVAGPVRLFGELRYLLADTPSPRGFSGMLPISVGLKF